MCECTRIGVRCMYVCVCDHISIWAFSQFQVHLISIFLQSWCGCYSLSLSLCVHVCVCVCKTSKAKRKQAKGKNNKKARRRNERTTRTMMKALATICFCYAFLSFYSACNFLTHFLTFALCSNVLKEQTLTHTHTHWDTRIKLQRKKVHTHTYIHVHSRWKESHKQYKATYKRTRP